MAPRRVATVDDDDDGNVMEVSVEYDSLYADLESNNSFFDDLVDMIPAKLYVSGNTGDEMYNPKYRKGQHKESKEARRARNKAARLAKFHPDLAETTIEAKRRKAREEEEESSSDDEGGAHSDDDTAGGASHKRRKAGGWAEAEERSTPPLSAEKLRHDDDDDEGRQRPPPPPLALDDPSSSRIEALRARLRAKIAERRSHRPGGGGGSGGGPAAGTPEAISKRAARRAEKQRRIEAAKKRAERGGGGGSTRVGTNDTATAKRFKMSEADMGGTVVNAASAGRGSASMSEDLAGVDFGGIAGLTETAHHLDNKSLARSGKKKSLDRLLAEAEKKRERLKELKAGDEEAKERAAKIQWGDTLKEASGERKRDDPALIKKAMKRKAKKKAKSQEAWKSRMEQSKEKMDERQKIRSHNLGKRKLGGAAGANLSRKRIATEEDGSGEGGKKEKRPRLGPHSGKGRAGFEGKKQDFINKGGKGAKGKAE